MRSFKLVDINRRHTEELKVVQPTLRVCKLFTSTKFTTSTSYHHWIFSVIAATGTKKTYLSVSGEQFYFIQVVIVMHISISNLYFVDFVKVQFSFLYTKHF